MDSGSDQVTGNNAKSCYGVVAGDSLSLNCAFWRIYLKKMVRLNSGIKNRLNFLAWAIYIFQKVVSDSVNHADSEDIKILIQFPGKSIFENFAQFLKKRGRHQYAWVFDSQNHSECSTFYADQFHI